MDQIENILSNVFSCEQPVAFFPVRHHSPACSHHLKKAIEIYRPDCVLIEGPSDTDCLIPCINSAEPPVSIYYSYQDPEGGRHACYYPMLEYSPELTALKTAAERDIPAHFIDLPFGSMILGEREVRSTAPTGGRRTYFDDYFLQRSRYIQALCEKENCRNYGELWEKLFEIPALDTDTQTFIRNMTTLCYFSRVDYPADLLMAELNTIREAFMAENILRYQKEYQRILVVTGGFHTSGLMELLGSDKIEKIEPVSGSAYLIPYSFEECDQLTGYNSGMPYPGYYQLMHEHLKAGFPDFCRKTTLIYITRLAEVLRKNRESISLSEEAAAFAMGLGLAELRGKQQPGVYELLDGVRSAFIKGEFNPATSFVMREATRLLRGEKTGKVGDDAPVPPIVLDFEATAKSFRMDISASTKKTVTLDIVSKPRHRAQSVFLHRLHFIDIPYAKKTYGPDFERRANTKLIREKWDYTYSGRVTSALIEKSHLGGSVTEACESKISDIMKNECHTSADAALLLVKAGVMALFAHTERLIGIVGDTIHNDHSFVSLADCIKSLSFLRGVEHILRIERMDKLALTETQALVRIIPMIPTLTAADEKEDFSLAQSLRSLYQVAAGDENETCLANLSEALVDLIHKKNVPPSLDGAATGLLYSAGQLSLQRVLGRAKAYFTATGKMLPLSGRFLRGLFLTAKDVVFYDDGFLSGLNETIGTLHYDDFLQLLPDLRLSFTSFSPREIDRIGGKVLALMGLSAQQGETDLTRLPALDERDYKHMMEIDGKVFGYLKEKGYIA